MLGAAVYTNYTACVVAVVTTPRGYHRRPHNLRTITATSIASNENVTVMYFFADAALIYG